MKKGLIISLSLALLTNGCAPKPCEVEVFEPVLTCINIIDQEGTSETISNPTRLEKYIAVDFLKPQPYQKVLRVYNRDPYGNLPSFITSYHPNGIPNQYLEVINGRAKGTYLEWYQDGTQKISAYVIGGVGDLTTTAQETWLFDGINKAWDEKGLLQAELEYCKGELHGLSTYYHPNGCIWKKIPFNRNKIEGDVEIFLENGNSFQSMSYSMGLKNGPSIRFWCDGSIAAEECYSWGKLNSGKYFDIRGKLVAEVVEGSGFRAVFGKESLTELQEYNQGIQEGKVQVFARIGGIVQTYNIRNGLKHGEEYWFYERTLDFQNSKPKLMLTWYEGKVQGLVKTWYPNGIQESQRELSSNSKNGLSSAWYEDGSLMLIEEYEKDKLTRGEYYKKGDNIPVSQIIEGRGIATLFDEQGTFLQKIEYVRGLPEFEN